MKNDKKTILKQRADKLSISLEKKVVSGEQIKVLEFLLSTEKYAIDSTYINEVISISEITPLPCTPDFIVGIINLRGKIISVMDIKKFLSISGADTANIKKVIIVKHSDIELGIIADEILGNSIIQLNEIQTKVTSITDVNKNFITGVTNKKLIVLDIKELLLSEKIIINEEI
ncbi:MAG: chemotaxis protein CheW [Salinivirgaceae bacterium]|nr:chemotaxis protein CheW [Salinivirgaceae bacterium]